MLPEGACCKRVQGADKAGLQVMIHAIGDEANKRILDIYGRSRDKTESVTGDFVSNTRSISVPVKFPDSANNK